MSTTKQDITGHLMNTVGFNGRDSKQIVESFFNLIRQALAYGDEVKLSGFGVFMMRDKRARPGRNPKNKLPFEIKARRVVTFSASPILRARCNEPE